MKQNIFKLTAVICTFFLALSCSEDDATGYSTVEPTSPTLSVDWGFENTQTLVEEEKSYPFTVTLSEPQVVDVQVDLQQVGGDATEGDDFAFPHSITIPAGQTSATGEIVIHADDLIEEPESVQIQIGSGLESNVSTINSETITFNIGNLEEGDLMLNMSWSLDEATTDNSGNPIDATAFADLRLLLTPSLTFTPSDIIETADGAGFESLTITEDLPDGDYYVVADFYAANENISRDISLELSLNQTGVINDDTYSFPAALNNGQGTCPQNYYVLAKITKSGDSYTVENVGTPSVELIEYTAYPNGFDVIDAFNPDGWSSQIEAKQICNSLLITGINATWMLEVWGEEIQTEEPVLATIAGDGTITIDSQYIFTTLYDGDTYDYTISGTGTYDDETGAIHLEYELDQDGFSPSQWMLDNGYMDTSYFVADVSRN